VLGRQRTKLAIVQRQPVLDRTEDVEIPLRDVGLGHGSEVEERPAVGRGERLAWRDARRINAFGNAFSFEERGHFRGVYEAAGILPFHRPPLTPWARGPAGSALESHSRGPGFEPPRVHRLPSFPYWPIA